jgi:Uma2 family endonuclease
LGTIKGQYPHTADLVVEVVSEGKEDRERDLVTKREVYAEAGIAEYWIVDPKRKRITILTLDRDTYVVHGEFAPGAQATSALLSGFALDVQAVFAAAS